MRKLLIVVDVQKDFVDGALGSPQAMAIIPMVRDKIKEYVRLYDGEIIFTKDTHNNNYLETQEGKNLPVEHCIFETEGWEIYSDLDKDCDDYGYVFKDTFGYYNWEDVIPTVDENCIYDEIELIGLCTGICVVSNALILKAIFPETKITVDAKCCACVSEESHKAALMTMRTCQINVINETN